MAIVKAFKAVRPKVNFARQIASLPYDVYDLDEAISIVKENPLSFLKVDMAQVNFDVQPRQYDSCIYKKARQLLYEYVRLGMFQEDAHECYYIYQLVMNGRVQTGVVACCSIDEYESGIIKRHEETRLGKEKDRTYHIKECMAQTGPVFMCYRGSRAIDDIVDREKKCAPIYDFVAPDGVEHTVWKVTNTENVMALCEAFAGVSGLYIADGHHRAASAVKVGMELRSEYPLFTQREEFNYFLSVLFPAEQVKILPYNRVVRLSNGKSKEQILHEIAKNFAVRSCGRLPYSPSRKGTFGMFLGGEWFCLDFLHQASVLEDEVQLDASILQEYLLGPTLGIHNPSTDQRIDFVAGTVGLEELERRVGVDEGVAFSMYAVSVDDMMRVSDASQLMPPKSTWFEPKLRSGLFVHFI